jgi:hypothetical protein
MWNHMSGRMEPHLHEPLWDVLCATTQEEADASLAYLRSAARGEEGPTVNAPSLVDEMKALHESMGGTRPTG